MNFASIQFAVFLLVLLAAYRTLHSYEKQNTLLLVTSYYFYGCWDPRFLLLILMVTFASYWSALKIQNTSDPKLRNLFLAGYAAFSLSVLGLFKYFDFFLDSAHAVLTLIGFNPVHWHLGLILPAAISFFTFESLSYVIETHQKHLTKPTSFKHYALFIAFFPKLVAGPIERPAVLIPQICAPRVVNGEKFTRGLFLILLGLFKKIVIADGLAPTVASVFDTSATPNSWEIIVGVYAFAMQIYCDFSGYSDIARGVSRLFGIELSQNFRFPYFSSSPSEFWRRWHISLSSWLRDYLYIPLGGNRVSSARTNLNLMITMLLGGLWHGAAWNYVLWGAYQGGILVVQRVLPNFESGGVAIPVRILKTIIFFQFVCFGWLLFRAHSWQQIVDFSMQLMSAPGTFNLNIKLPSIATNIGVVVMLIYDFFAYRSDQATAYRQLPEPVRAGFYAVLLILIFMGMTNQRSAFIYFQF